MLAPSAAWLPLAALRDLDGWRDLADRAAEPNVFYEPAFLSAAMAAFGPKAGAIAVKNRDGRPIGLFPALVELGRYAGAGAVISGFTHPFGPLGTPLVRGDSVDEAVDAWLDHLTRDEATPSVLRLPLVTEDGPFSASLDRALAARGLPQRRFNRHARALLHPQDNRTGYLEGALNNKIRKELGRKRRRLAEMGALAHRVVTDRGGIAAALEQFLALEAGGWKGRAGTAAVQQEHTRRFMQDAVLSLAAENKARCDVLTAGGRVVAAAIVLHSGAAAWLWKIAYDEDVARLSPGVLLTCDVTGSLLSDTSVAYADSCATPDHPMIDRLWRQRLVLSDRLILLRPERRMAFAATCALEALRGATVSTAKKARALLGR